LEKGLKSTLVIAEYNTSALSFIYARLTTLLEYSGILCLVLGGGPQQPVTGAGLG
jgi:E3 ubiquitin-protein ligase RNFT1